MKLTRQGYNSFSLEGLTTKELTVIWDALYYKDNGNNGCAKSMHDYLSNCNIVGAEYSGNPDDVNAIKTREE